VVAVPVGVVAGVVARLDDSTVVIAVPDADVVGTVVVVVGTVVVVLASVDRRAALGPRVDGVALAAPPARTEPSVPAARRAASTITEAAVRREVVVAMALSPFGDRRARCSMAPCSTFWLSASTARVTQRVCAR
jgi:hypothetical protein